MESMIFHNISMNKILMNRKKTLQLIKRDKKLELNELNIKLKKSYVTCKMATAHCRPQGCKWCCYKDNNPIYLKKAIDNCKWLLKEIKFRPVRKKWEFVK